MTILASHQAVLPTFHNKLAPMIPGRKQVVDDKNWYQKSLFDKNSYSRPTSASICNWSTINHFCWINKVNEYIKLFQIFRFDESIVSVYIIIVAYMRQWVGQIPLIFRRIRQNWDEPLVL